MEKKVHPSKIWMQYFMCYMSLLYEPYGKIESKFLNESRVLFSSILFLFLVSYLFIFVSVANLFHILLSTFSFVQFNWSSTCKAYADDKKIQELSYSSRRVSAIDNNKQPVFHKWSLLSCECYLWFSGFWADESVCMHVTLYNKKLYKVLWPFTISNNLGESVAFCFCFSHMPKIHKPMNNGVFKMAWFSITPPSENTFTHFCTPDR